MSRRRLYLFLLIASALGYLYLIYHISSTVDQKMTADTTVCVFKNISGIPCPSCGSTRSVLAIYRGEFLQALRFNPIGYLLALFLIVAPIWIIRDLISRKDSFYIKYQQIEKVVRTKPFAYPLLFLVLVNWIWNIYKYL